MRKILIIDDNAINRELIVDILTPTYTVFIAKDGFQGIQLALEKKPDLIVCDIMMPKLDGYEVLKTVRDSSELSYIPFIFLTAKTEKSDFRFGMDSGADDYLTKPFSSDELLTAIDTRLKRKVDQDKELHDKVKEIYNNLNTNSAHEFNTPLNAIIGFTSLIISNFNKFSKEEIINMLCTVKNSSKRLHRTTNNILLYSHLEKFNETTEKYIVSEVSDAKEIILNILNLFFEKGCKDKINFKIADAIISISDEDLSKIIEEIVSNALNFSPDNKQSKITSKVIQSFYEINITDYGRGFNKEELLKIGPYVQFNRKQFEQQGMGLGLYLAKKLTELNKGIFSITSEKNIGTTIKISLPLKKK